MLETYYLGTPPKFGASGVFDGFRHEATGDSIEESLIKLFSLINLPEPDDYDDFQEFIELWAHDFSKWELRTYFLILSESVDAGNALYPMQMKNGLIIQIDPYEFAIHYHSQGKAELVKFYMSPKQTLKQLNEALRMDEDKALTYLNAIYL